MHDVCAAIQAHRYHYASEADLQEGVAAALLSAGFTVRPEVSLDAAGRIDFLVGRVGVEVKAQRRWSFPAVVEQLQRYLSRPEIDAVVLVTDRTQLSRMPASLNGKPVGVVRILGGIR